jgi:ribosomal-protein-alanine N-acetyltransferase
LQWSFGAIDEADLDFILEVENLSFPKPWSRLAFLNELAAENSGVYALKSEDIGSRSELVGYVCLRLILDEMHILKIAVAPQWRRRGAAAHLIEKSMAEASRRHISKIMLEVRPSNHPAVRFYLKSGFQIIGKRKNYYPETREDAWVMMKNI